MNTVKMRLLSIVLFFPFILIGQPDAFFEEGKKLQSAGKLNEAMEYYGLAIKDSPSNEAAIFNRALCALELKKMKTFKNDIDHLLELNPYNIEALQWRGGMRMNDKNWQGAINDFTVILQKEDDFGIRLSRVISYLETNQPELAKADLEDLTNAPDLLSQARLNAVLGDYYLKIGNPEEAITQYQKTLDINPNDAIVLNNCGLIHTKNEDFEKAIPFFEDAFQLVADPQIHANLIMAYLKNGNLENAEAASKSFILQNHDEPLAYYAQGMVHFENENYGEAIEEFTQAVDLDKKFIDGLLMRGKASLKLEQTVAAKEDFEKVLQIDPTNEEAKTLSKE